VGSRHVTAETASALASVKSVLAIVNGLTLTNTLLVLITGATYSKVITLDKLDAEDIAFAVVLMATIVRFYHGNMRHLDSAYGNESAAPVASGRHAETRGGLGLDFLVVLTQSVMFAVASFYVGFHSEYVSIFIVLLVFDIAWAVYSVGSDAQLDSPQRTWILINFFATACLVLFYLIHRSHPARHWSLDATLVVLAVTTVLDFALNWDFYFPSGGSQARES
jgi:hypothetical protein